ncbi:MAG: flagellar biosynthetic protein FliQ [Neptuniibacter caesariensis]|uniref:Flagellar biosynthetic protein FliQ n=1 Tax=Neptuniibacter caesariensis TaxID=207954 RepID=A0A2G6JMA0_NEPCE|nr:MAG: flagellar biosynthetic protein FliQ [Neptuniibacter caesariensis]
MTPEVVLSLFGDAFWLIVLLVSVIIVPSLLVGLVVSTFQAATQINEQTLSFLPRLLVTILMIMWAGPWILTQLTEHFTSLVKSIPYLIG